MFSPANNGRIIGPAVTVKMVEAGDTSAPKLDKHFVDQNEDGGIMYIQQPKGLPSACWGGLMSTRAQFLGAKGVVIDGRMRDVNEHKGMGFSVSGNPKCCTRTTYLWSVERCYLTCDSGIRPWNLHSWIKHIYKSLYYQ